MRKFVGIFSAMLLMGVWAGCGSSGPVQKVSFVNFDGSNNTQVYTLSSDGKTSTKLNITVPQDAFFVTPSPDASEVAYCKYVDDETDQAAIFMMDLKGNEKRLTSGGNWGDCIPSFSRDGKKIVFESYRDDPNFVQIYVMNADGSGQKRILTDSADNFFPQLSPDGKTVVFFRFGSGSPTGITPARPALAISQRWQNPSTRWSSNRISARRMSARTAVHSAIHSNVISTGDGLYIVNLDGSNPKQVLPGTTVYPSAATFASDGKKIVFATQQFDENGNDFEIASVNLDGTGVKNLSNNPDSWDFAPVVIGDTIYFNRENSDGYVDIYQMKMDGSGQKNLTNTPTENELLPGYYAFAG